MQKRMLLLVVLALVIQVFGETLYWTEAFVVTDSPSIGRGEKAGLAVGASNRLTVRPFDGTAQPDLVPCGAIFSA